jgi:tetratricopeptide (TPR) repeat protein
MRFTINWRFLLKLIAAVVVVAVPIHLLHRYQVRKQVDVFLRHADEARDKKEPEREINFLRRYLMARPNDLDTRERLARALCKNAKSGRQLTEGYLAVEDVLRRDPDRQELRRFAIDFALDPRLGLYAEARVHIDYLLDPKRRPNDGELEGLYAKSLALQGRFGVSSTDVKGAWHWYERSIGHRKDLIDSYIGLAGILRFQLRQTDEADRLIAAMLGVDRNDPKKQDVEAAKNLQNFRTFVYLAEYWRSLNRGNDLATAVAPAVADAQYGRQVSSDLHVRDAVAHAVEKAQSLAPDELDVLLLAAEAARDQARSLAAARKQEEAEQVRTKARQHLARAMDLHPKSSAVYLAAAALDAETKSLAEALATVRKGCEILPDSRDLLLALLDYQIRSADARGASETLDRLANTGLPPVLMDYHHARILALEDRWLDVALVLTGIREEAASDPVLSRQVHLLLAQCSVQLGEYDNALAAFQRARPDNTSDPLWIPVMLGIAEMQAALGQDEEALATYRDLTDYAGGAWVHILRLEMLRVFREPDERKRDWTAALAARDAADRYFPDPRQAPTNFRILKAELESFRGNHDAARQSLKELQEERSQELPVRLAVAAEEERSGNPAAAAAVLADAERDLGDSQPLRLARARLWVESKPNDLAAKLESLVAGAEKFPRAEQRRLLRGLADMAHDNGFAELAGRILEKLAVLQPDDLSVRLVLFDRALQAGRLEDAAVVQREIQRIDGETGTSARFSKAVLALWRAQKRNDRSGLSEARILLEAVELRRPHWGRVALALALLHDLRGDADTAIDKFREALGKGETSPAALRRYMQLLYLRSRFDEAVEVLHRLGESVALSPDARRLAAEIERRNGNLAGAIQHAIQAVPPDSKNAKDQLWLGQLFWAARRYKDAEAALQKATELDPAATDGWLVLIQFLNATNRPEDARKALETAKDKVEKTEQSLFLGRASTLIGDYNSAASAFRKASAERPTHVPTLQAEAEFLFLTRDLPAAREAFDRVVHLKSATPEEREAALTMLAFAFAADQDYETSRRALETLELLRPKTSAETPAQRRNRILILARRNDPASRLQAIRLLEEDRGSLTATDQFLLAQLYRTLGSKHWPQVRVVMADLLRRPGAAKVPLYLSFYAKFLLDEGDPTEAAKWIDRLKETRGDALETAILEARLLAARKELPKARSLLLKRAEMEKAPLDAIAQACEDIGLFEDAEVLLKRYVAEAQASNPRAPLELAMFYGRRNRVVEALPICESISASVPVSEVADVVVTVLYLAKSRSPEDIARAYQWVEAMAAKTPGQPLFRQLGDIRNLQEDYAAAIDLYRRAIAANPKDAQSLNNLAFLLSALEKKHDEALKLIEQARRAAGPDNPNLLDTKAIILLNKGEFVAARQPLERILAVTPNAVAYFHLAQVEDAAERDLEARVAWKHAADLGFKRDDLHPLERPGFDQLARELK